MKPLSNQQRDGVGRNLYDDRKRKDAEASKA